MTSDKSCMACRFYTAVEPGGSYPENPACRPCVGYSEFQPRRPKPDEQLDLFASTVEPRHVRLNLRPTSPPEAALPDGNPKTRFGMAKPPLALIPAAAKVLVSMAFGDGASKYGPANWRIDPVTASTYLNAAERHIDSWIDGEEAAADSGVHHLAHAAACLMILLDAQYAGTLNDDRPPKAATADLIKALTKSLT
jgi:hypothetical protein